MRYAVKTAVKVRAWRLGDQSAMEMDLIAQGKIRLREDGAYELFSQEATGETGQIAYRGDYFKVDSSTRPYPNDKAFFEAHHTPLGEDWYLQSSSPLPIWTAEEPMNDAVRFLLDTGALAFHPEDPARYYSAFLWGTTETAARDAVILFYAIERSEDGRIIRVEFNFVARGEFDAAYTVLDQSPADSGPAGE